MTLKPKTKTKYLVILILFFSTKLFGGEQDLLIKKETKFTGECLYGFMNGGADLYLEYGFSELIYRELTYRGEDFSVELYKMRSPEDAFGIHSVLSFRCISADSLGRVECLTKYQLQAVSGNYFISVVFSSGSLNGRAGAYELISKFLPNDESKVNFPDFVQEKKRYTTNLFYCAGSLGLSNLPSAISSLLEGISAYKLWYYKDGLSSNRCRVFFSDNQSLSIVKQRIPASDIVSINNLTLDFKF